MSDKVHSPKILRLGKRSSAAVDKGSTEPPLFSAPIVLSASKSKDKGKSLVGTKGANVHAKRTAHTFSLLTKSSSSGARVSVSARPSAASGIGQSFTEGSSASGANARSSIVTGSKGSTRALPAAAGGETRPALASPTSRPTDIGLMSEIARDPPSSPPSSSEKGVPGQGDPVRIRADAHGPDAHSISSGNDRLGKLESLIQLLLEKRADRVSVSGVIASGSGGVGSSSGATISCPGLSGSGSGGPGSGSVSGGSVSGNAGRGNHSSAVGSVELLGSGSCSAGSYPTSGAARTSGSAEASGIPPPLELTELPVHDNSEVVLEDDDSMYDVPAPVLRRELGQQPTRECDFLLQQAGPSHEFGLDLAEDTSVESEAALLFAGMDAVASIDRKYIEEVRSASRPGCLGAASSSSVVRRYAPSRLVPNWMNFHLNYLRGAKDLGADTWSQDLRPIAEWQPANLSQYASCRKLFKPHRPLVSDPALPPPAPPTEAEAALVPPHKRPKGSHPSASFIATGKVLGLEQRMHTAAEAIGVASTLTSALSDAIRDPSDRDQLNDNPNADAVLSTLDALPAALSYAANALAKALINSQISRRETILDKADLPKGAASRLRLVPPSAGSLFGPHLDSVRQTTDTRTPPWAEDLARALKATPQGKRNPPASGWGSKRFPKRQNQPAFGAPPPKRWKGNDRRGPPPHGRGRGRQLN